MKKNTCIIILSLSIFYLTMNSSFAEKQTVLLYMMGCDLETDSGAATEDLIEVLRATKESSVHVIAYLCGSESWWLPGLENGHCYAIEIQQGNMTLLRDFGRQPSATDEQFSLFLREYGKSENDLILWGHGFPGFTGIGVDSLMDEDTLTLAEIQKGLQASGLHFRLIGFDACEMATLEAAWLLAPYADWFAASPQIEALSGWDYRAVIRYLSDMENDAPLKLREAGLQAARRNPSVLPLTVIDENHIIENADNINQILDGAMYPGEPVSLAQLAASCPDREAGDAVLRLLDGQILTLFNPDENLTVSLPGIQDSYAAFLTRR